jgi:hypothetical protein
MLRIIGLIALSLLLLAGPASAVSYKQKMATCKFGADNEKLTGKKRSAFIHKCMGHHNYVPQARKDAMKKSSKKKAAMKKPTKTMAKPEQKKQ